jgi:hypothetical protein
MASLQLTVAVSLGSFTNNLKERKKPWNEDVEGWVGISIDGPGD